MSRPTLIIKVKTLVLTIILLYTLFTTSLIRSDSIVQEVQQLNFMDFLVELFASEKFHACSLQFFRLELQNSTGYPVNDLWMKRDILLTSAVRDTINTNGIVISQVQNGKRLNDSRRTYQQPQKISHSRRCSIVVIIILNPFNFLTMEDEMIKTQISTPGLNPPTVRNRDKYLILSSEKIVHDIYNSMFIKSLKYKLILILKHDSLSPFTWGYASTHFKVQVMRFCQYGLCGQCLLNKYSVKFKYIFRDSDVNSLFPDQERNFCGHNLRLSTTTKVPQLLELDIAKDTNGNDIFIAKRGLYASVLSELSAGLNFTYTIVPSSGGGSTGHALPNGTWVGIVGDTYKGIVDFGFMAAITFSRFPYAEFCAPINFAYLGFVTGPPRKSFSWKAILWPFSPATWVCLTGVIVIASSLMLLFAQSSINLNYSEKSIKLWKIVKAASFLIRILLEQCPELPRSGTRISFKTFLIFWLMFSLVISTVYRSKMVSLLTFPSLEHIPVDFDELASAKDFKIDFHYFGNVGYAYFKSSTNPSFMKIYSRMGREPNPLTCMERTLHDKSACIIFILPFKELLHRNLSDRYGKSPLKFTRHEGAMFPAGVIHEHKAPLSSNFKSILLPALETGLIPFWEQTDLDQVLENKNLWQKENNIEAVTWDNGVNDSLLRVRNLQGAFVILILGTIAAIFAFVAENRDRYASLICCKTVL